MPDEFEQAGLEAPRLEGNQFLTPGLQAGAPPEQFRLPSHDQLKELARTPEGQARLAAILEHYGITEPIETAKARALQFSQRLQMIPPGSPEYVRLEQEIIAQYTGQELMGMTRYVSQQYSSLIAIDGDPNQDMMWLPEDFDPTRVCDSCAARAGKIKTWAEWKAIGEPGPAVCQGGNRCRCELIAA